MNIQVPESRRFGARMDRARAHEDAVLDRLGFYGWDASAFGQAMLPHEQRKLLRESRSLLRWMPDILAIRSAVVLLVDAKAEFRTDTPNHSLEAAAFESHILWDQVGVPVVYVWGDFTATRLRDIRPGRKFIGRIANGSGTDYYLIPRVFGESFDSVFGVEEEAA